MIKSRKLSIVIPVYNEEKFIEETVKRVMLQKVKYFKYKEVIVVNDGSTDSTFKILNKLKTKYKDKLQVINKKVNQGKGAALKDGFKKTTGDVVIVQDADLEYSPSDYDILLEPFVEHNADVVYGSRLNIYRPHRVMYFWHSVANNILTTFSNMFTNLNLSDMETGFKCFRGDLIRKIAPEIRSKRFGFEPEITARIAKIKGIRFYEVGISYEGRTYEEGKKIGWKDGVKAFWEVIRYNLFD
jgi:glycosyltransferase involved in cell wall biosynthesis